MDKIAKLLVKISKKDREKLLTLISLILAGDKNLKIIKIKNTDFFCLRQGKFWIIFHKEKKDIVIDSIKMRDENTYKNL